MRIQGDIKSSARQTVQSFTVTWVPSDTVGWPSFRDYLPLWLGGHNHTDESLSGMLKSLKIAIESHLEASMSTAEITVPFPISDTFFDYLRSTAKSLSRIGNERL